MSDETSYLILVYVFGRLERVVLTFKNDFLSSADIKYFKEPDIVEKISQGFPSTWNEQGKDILEVTRLDYVFPKVIESME